jgi:hypothetical protein
VSPIGPPITKRPVGIDVVLGVLVQHFLGQRSLDDVLQNVGAQVFVGNRLRVLAGNDDGIDADRLVVLVVFHCDLGLAIGPEVRKQCRSCGLQ